MSTSQHELIILLIGPSGSGKSSFVQSLTSESVPVSNVKPCTELCKSYKVEPMINGRRKAFTLIDTPGFVDTQDENLIVLEKIARALIDLTPQKLFGAIYFHNISESRMKGTTTEALDIFKAICGKDFFPHIVCITTMWDFIKPRHHKELQALHDELEKGPMNLKDAPVVYKRLRDDDQCTKEVLDHFSCLALERPSPPTLHMVNELRGGSRNVASTAAGRRILKDPRKQPSYSCCTVM